MAIYIQCCCQRKQSTVSKAAWASCRHTISTRLASPPHGGAQATASAKRVSKRRHKAPLSLQVSVSVAAGQPCISRC